MYDFLTLRELLEVDRDVNQVHNEHASACFMIVFICQCEQEIAFNRDDMAQGGVIADSHNE